MLLSLNFCHLNLLCLLVDFLLYLSWVENVEDRWLKHNVSKIDCVELR